MKDVTPLKITPWDGKKISLPGIYSGVNMDAYHGDLCARPSVSSGGLRKIEDRSAEHYFDGSYLNPNRKEEETKAAFTMGRAVHTLFMGETGFRKQFVVRPDKAPDGRDWHHANKTCQQWLGEAAEARLEVLKPEQLADIQGMAKKLGAHPTIQAGALRGLVEHTIAWEVLVPVKLSEAEIVQVPVWLKSRPDSIPMDANMIVDLKTAADASPLAVRRAISDHGYHMQMALAIWGIRAVTGREITDAILIFQETTRPYSINHKPLLAEALNRGHQQNLRALFKFARGVATGDWVGYDDDQVPADLMPWLESRLAREEEHSYLPKMEYLPSAPITAGLQGDDEAV